MTLRFIPTPVGNTVRLIVCEHLLHGSSPRLWGTHAVMQSERQSFAGSSPRLWGTRRSASGHLARLTVHPHACGEHSQHSVAYGLNRAVHPHACGEHAARSYRNHGYDRFIPTPVGNTLAWHQGTGRRGSSPRLWGTRTVLEPDACSLDRFIPTPVGNTYCTDSYASIVSGSSPRLWGTHMHALASNAVHTGSSPRLWGTPA